MCLIWYFNIKIFNLSGCSAKLFPCINAEISQQACWVEIFKFLYDFYLSNNLLLLLQPFNFLIINNRNYRQLHMKEVVISLHLIFGCFHLENPHSENYNRLLCFNNNPTSLIFSDLASKVILSSFFEFFKLLMLIL